MMQANDNTGLSLVELIIGMAVGLIVMAAALNTFISSQSASKNIDQKASMAVNARGAMYLIEDNIRLMGFNPAQDMDPQRMVRTAGKGVLVFERNDLDYPFDPDKNRVVSIGLLKSHDSNRDGFASSGVSGLVIDGQRAADNIAAIRFAYAYDADADGAVEVSGSKNVLWAFDADDDGFLDRHLDTNDDGFIDQNDSPGGTPIARVSVSRIRAVKVWLLVRSKNKVNSAPEDQVFFMGGEKYSPDGSYAHSLVVTSIRCRNMF
jgi:type IV pilus assembly protein PilW